MRLCAVFVIVFGVVVLVSALVQAQVSVCSEHESETQNHCDRDTLRSVRLWWRQMSARQPLKCQVPSDWYEKDSQFVDLFTQSVPVFSYPCDANDNTVAYKFQGQVQDGQLHGLGHLELDTYSSMRSHGTCLKVNRIGGLEPVEIIGTFASGTLQGNVRILLENGASMIGSFHKGLAEGLVREWDVQGNLTSVSFYQQGFKIGKCWAKFGNWLIYQDCSTSGRSDDKAIALSLEKGKPLLTGEFSRQIFTLNNIQQAELKKSFLEDKSCMMKVQVEAGKDLDFYYDLYNDQAIPLSAYMETPLCDMDQHRRSSPSKNLQNWFKFLDDLMKEQSGQQILMLLKPEDSQVDQDSQKIIDNIIFNREHLTAKLREPSATIQATFLGKERSGISAAEASFDSEGQFHGHAVLVFPPNDKVQFGFNFDDVIALRGDFVHGQLSGVVALDLQDFRTVYLTVKNGVAHGPAIIAGFVPILPTRLERPTNELIRTQDFDKLGFIGKFKNGKPYGTFWLQMVGGGFMHGEFDRNGEATGDNLAYIYPDMETAFEGRFENFVMKKAHEAQVNSIHCHVDGIIAVSKFSRKSEPIFYYDPPTNVSFGAGPEGIVDPYELKWVEVAVSSVPNSGEGVFAKKDIPKFQCTSMYSGLMFNAGEQAYLRSLACDFNNTRSMEYRRNCSKYTLTLGLFQTAISIPPELDTPKTFQPTIGPKVNHDFLRNNSAYVDMEHPRWGSIMCVQSRIPIKKGEEIFTFYGYKRGSFPNDFPWYFESLSKLSPELRKEFEIVLTERPESSTIKTIGVKKPVGSADELETRDEIERRLNQRPTGSKIQTSGQTISSETRLEIENKLNQRAPSTTIKILGSENLMDEMEVSETRIEIEERLNKRPKGPTIKILGAKNIKEEFPFLETRAEMEERLNKRPTGTKIKIQGSDNFNREFQTKIKVLGAENLDLEYPYEVPETREEIERRLGKRPTGPTIGIKGLEKSNKESETTIKVLGADNLDMDLLMKIRETREEMEERLSKRPTGPTIKIKGAEKLNQASQADIGIVGASLPNGPAVEIQGDVNYDSESQTTIKILGAESLDFDLLMKIRETREQIEERLNKRPTGPTIKIKGAEKINEESDTNVKILGAESLDMDFLIKIRETREEIEERLSKRPTGPTIKIKGTKKFDKESDTNIKILGAESLDMDFLMKICETREEIEERLSKRPTGPTIKIKGTNKFDKESDTNIKILGAESLDMDFLMKIRETREEIEERLNRRPTGPTIKIIGAKDFDRDSKTDIKTNGDSSTNEPFIEIQGVVSDELETQTSVKILGAEDLDFDLLMKIRETREDMEHRLNKRPLGPEIGIKGVYSDNKATTIKTESSLNFESREQMEERLNQRPNGPTIGIHGAEQGSQTTVEIFGAENVDFDLLTIVPETREDIEKRLSQRPLGTRIGIQGAFSGDVETTIQTQGSENFESFTARPETRSEIEERLNLRPTGPTIGILGSKKVDQDSPTDINTVGNFETREDMEERLSQRPKGPSIEVQSAFSIDQKTPATIKVLGAETLDMDLLMKMRETREDMERRLNQRPKGPTIKIKGAENIDQKSATTIETSGGKNLESKINILGSIDVGTNQQSVKILGADNLEFPTKFPETREEIEQRLSGRPNGPAIEIKGTKKLEATEIKILGADNLTLGSQSEIPETRKEIEHRLSKRSLGPEIQVVGEENIENDRSTKIKILGAENLDTRHEL